MGCIEGIGEVNMEKELTLRPPLAYYDIRITQADIDAGVRGKCALCPVALAVNRTFGVETASAYTTVIYRKDGHLFEADLPDRIRWWIAEYDTGSEVKPTGFFAFFKVVEE